MMPPPTTTTRAWEGSAAGEGVFTRDSLPFEIARQHIPGHALDHGISLEERGHPLAASGVEHLTPAAGEANDHSRTPLHPLYARISAVAEHGLRHVSRILVGQKPVIERALHPLFLEARHSEREDGQVRRRPARRGRLGKAPA